ncbi:hypothetical protein MCMEM_0389 [Methanococcoides methylutens MM1]|uniref:Uncharacterized protein n=2 Tax=Methanococcoides methylutens TaxID=2226 RepID=A0A0E3SQV7_METMT|nr:hypothetical protein MCMEM_0389 [Methanococcoides methylutens MM1]
MGDEEFAFSVAIRDLNIVKGLSLRCDCTNEVEINGMLDIGEITLIEGTVLRISGKFGEIDLSITRSKLERILKEGENK